MTEMKAVLNMCQNLKKKSTIIKINRKSASPPESNPVVRRFCVYVVMPVLPARA